jgi:hypothetical protein
MSIGADRADWGGTFNITPIARAYTRARRGTPNIRPNPPYPPYPPHMNISTTQRKEQDDTTRNK